MRILLVIDHLGSGGAQRQIASLALGLSARGHSIEVFAYYPDNFFKELLLAENIRIHFQPKRSRFDLRVFFGLARQMRRGQYDAVLAYLDTPIFYAEFARG